VPVAALTSSFFKSLISLFLSINEIKDLLNNGTIPKDCIDTRFKRFKKKIKSLLGLEKKNKIDYHIIIMSYDDSINHYIDIKILPDLYDAMMYCDELSEYKLNVFLYSITNGNGTKKWRENYGTKDL